MRKTMVEKDHSQLSVRAQCQLLGVNRNRLEPKKPKDWKPGPEHTEMLELVKLAHAKDPTMGARQLLRVLKRNGYETSRWTVGKMMKHLGIKAIYCTPRTTVPAPDDEKRPYLLRDREVTEPDEAWATDITYIPWRRGHVYLTAIIDWKTRAILSWRVSNTMDVGFCLEALGEALEVAGTAPQIVNTDQGSQYTGSEWIAAVENTGAQVSMDGRGRWQDNVLIERFWRSVKHEWVLLHEYNTLAELEALLGEWIERYNTWRPHTANGGQTPWQAYRGIAPVLEREEGGRKSGDENVRLSASASSLTFSHSVA
ncbi:MAG: IS3 family transposase [bacterium]|nr:IS3 family transposase [bacterium]